VRQRRLLIRDVQLEAYRTPECRGVAPDRAAGLLTAFDLCDDVLEPVSPRDVPLVGVGGGKAQHPRTDRAHHDRRALRPRTARADLAGHSWTGPRIGW